jgi:hypothetical protein
MGGWGASISGEKHSRAHHGGHADIDLIIDSWARRERAMEIELG